MKVVVSAIVFALMVISVPARAESLNDPDPRCSTDDCCLHCVRLHSECGEKVVQLRATAAKLLETAKAGERAQAAVKAKAAAATKKAPEAQPTR